MTSFFNCPVSGVPVPTNLGKPPLLTTSAPLSAPGTEGERSDRGFATERLDAAPVRFGDAGALAALDDERLHGFTGDRVLGVGEWQARCRRIAEANAVDGRWWTWTLRLRGTGEVVGYVQATPPPGGGPPAELAWVIGADWQGRGLATEAARGVVGWLARRGIDEVEAAIAPGHRASERVAQHLGLRPTTEAREGQRVWRSTSRSNA